MNATLTIEIPYYALEYKGVKIALEELDQMLSGVEQVREEELEKELERQRFAG